jgi:hypothetical protein
MNKSLIKLCLAFSFVLTSLNAYEMKPVGFKAVGMGGTGVASTRGSLSSYYNPALLRFSDYTSELSINAGLRLREANIIDHIDTLSKIDFGKTVDNIANNVKPGNKEVTAGIGSEYTVGKNNKDEDRKNITTAQETLKKIGSKNAVEISVEASFATQFSDAFAIGYYKHIDYGLNLNINPNYTELIFKYKEENTNKILYYQYQANYPKDKRRDVYKGYAIPAEGKKAYEEKSIDYALNNKINYIQLNGEDLNEIPLSYAHLFNTKRGSLSVGGSLKFMTLKTTYKKVALGEKSDKLTDGLESSTTTYKANVGLDLGVAFRPKDSKVTLGLVAKNIYLPKFKVEESKNGINEDYKIDALYRAGISVPVWNNNIEFALDVDLTKNETLIKDEKSQMLGAGVELHPSSWFALRLGAMKDLASETYDDGMIMTGGLGIGLKWFQIDLSAMVSSNKGRYDNKDIPRYISANLSIISRWGYGYNK